MRALSLVAFMTMLVIVVEGVPPTDAVLLTAVLIAASALLARPGMRASGDGVTLSIGAAAITVPAVIGMAAIVQRWDAAFVAACAALWMAGRPWHAPPVVATLPRVPAGVYLLALAYVAFSVAAPFGHFNLDSQVRELYTDGFQRFGVVHALTAQVPPANPFVAGLPLRYYWFSLAPIAALTQVTGASPFDAWKVWLTWQALAFVIGVWSIAAVLLRSHAAAWAACVLAIVIPSAEILWHPGLAAARDAFSFSREGVMAAIAVLTRVDPDHSVGVLVPHSDQLFMEDFLYIPQNAAALMIFLGVIALARQRAWLTAGWATAAYIGTNTFFVIPGGAALAVAAAASLGPVRAAVVLVWTLGWSLAWGTLCLVLPLTVATGTTMGLLLAAGALWCWTRLPAETIAAPVPGAARIAVLMLLAVLVMALAARPADVFNGLVANYALSIVAGIAAAMMVLFAGPRTADESIAVLIVATFIAVFLLTTLVVAGPFWGVITGQAADVAFRAGDVINPFNFYHKVAKGARVGWCLLGALAVARLAPWLRERRKWAALCLVPLLLAAPVLAATTVIRPLTYLHDEPAREAPAARLLHRLGATLDDVVLLEDFRTSRINQVGPASTFFVSSWSGGARSLSNAAGTWANQYVPVSKGPEVVERERINARVFASADAGAAILDLRRRYRIDYVLTPVKRDLGAEFVLLVDWPGAYLYRIK